MTARSSKIQMTWPWVAGVAVVVAGAIRYCQQPSFWLDEAYVAVSLRAPSVQTIFARLEYGVLFSRLYLLVIAGFTRIAGYHIWSLRLIPSLFFVAGTVMWARLLLQRAGRYTSVILLASGLLLGSTYWLDQAVQLKQYTLDVTLSLLPFLAGDDFFRKAFKSDERKLPLVALALPIVFSYAYAFALCARIGGWYLHQGRRDGWRLSKPAVLLFGLALALALGGLWFTEYRVDLLDRPAYLAYWDEWILRSALQRGPGTAVRLIAKFLWGWHGRQPMVTAVVAPLQVFGVISIIRSRGNRDPNHEATSWGSRSWGSLALLLLMIGSSVVVRYPICAGRIVLFTQVHTQILAVEGALFLFGVRRWKKVAIPLMYGVAGIVILHACLGYVGFVRAGVPENIFPMVRLIDPGISNTLWVHPCSEAQVKSLPDPLPVQSVCLAEEERFPREAKGFGFSGHIWAPTTV